MEAEAETSGSAEKQQGRWSCEEHWMVEGTVRDLQAMGKLGGAESGADTTVPAKAPHEYDVGKTRLKMAPSCWDLASYRPLLADWKLTPQPAGDAAPDLLHDLLTPTAKNLQKSNKSVSDRIKAAPSAARVHEEAAFVLGVFGLRQNARQFGDLRPLLCRMTAHLALAERLRGGKDATDIGKWAQVFYDCHAGRPVKAREEMKVIPAEGDARSWKRVVELQITGDWRQMQDLADPTLAEAIIQARALKIHRGNSEMMEYVTKHKDLQAIPEWSRLLSGPGRSVEEGHLAMRSGLAMEFLEMSEIFRIGKEPTPEKLAGFLAADAPSGLVGMDAVPQVISDADWAAYFRRHFYVICSDISRFTERQWGSSEATAEWEKSVLPYCRKLPDAELIEPLLASRVTDFQADMRKTYDYARQHPERVPMGLWFDYRFPNLNTKLEQEMPDQVGWFREVSPPGTAYDPKYRIRFTGIQGSDWKKRITELHQINPWDSELCYELAENTGNNASSVKAAWGEVREYSERPLKQILESPQLTTGERIETLQTLTSFSPEAGLDLGAAFVAVGKPAEAIKAYEAAYEKCPDRVAVSNKTRWMIYHYKSTGNDAKAREVADHNAEVFSSLGLESAFALAVQEKDAERAKKIAADIAERYDDGSYIGYAAWFVGGNETALHRVFPNGFQEAGKADFDTSKPAKGCRLEGASDITRALGIRSGDIIVAVDGKHVENQAQFGMLMRCTLDPHVRLTYRRGRQVTEIDCQLPDRRLQVDLSDAGR